LKNVNILALKMPGPGNPHCANIVSAHSFSVARKLMTSTSLCTFHKTLRADKITNFQLLADQAEKPEALCSSRKKELSSYISTEHKLALPTTCRPPTLLIDNEMKPARVMAALLLHSGVAEIQRDL